MFAPFLIADPGQDGESHDFKTTTMADTIEKNVDSGKTFFDFSVNTSQIWVTSLIPAGSHTFVEIDHEIISTVILHPSAESFKKVCCQLQAKVCAQSTG